MTTIPDLGQAHEKCGGVKLVKWVPNPPQRIGQRKKSKKTKSNEYFEIINFEVFARICCKTREIITSSFGPIAVAYSTLLFCRDPELSLFQRLLTIIGVRGHIEDMVCIKYC